MTDRRHPVLGTDTCKRLLSGKAVQNRRAVVFTPAMEFDAPPIP